MACYTAILRRTLDLVPSTTVPGFHGIGMFALPTGILGAGFVEEMQKQRRSPKTCPHRGKELTE